MIGFQPKVSSTQGIRTLMSQYFKRSTQLLSKSPLGLKQVVPSQWILKVGFEGPPHNKRILLIKHEEGHVPMRTKNGHSQPREHLRQPVPPKGTRPRTNVLSDCSPFFVVKSLNLSIHLRITCGRLLDSYTKLAIQQSKYPFKLFSSINPDPTQSGHPRQEMWIKPIPNFFRRLAV